MNETVGRKFPSLKRFGVGRLNKNGGYLQLDQSGGLYGDAA
jgi:hypothetical protein